MINLKWLRVFLVIMLILPVTMFSPPQVSAASEAIGVNLIVNNFLNDSTAKALSWVVFDGAKPPPSQVDNVTFVWYDPEGQLAFTVEVDPDSEAVAWSYYHVNQLGEWSVNITYQGNTSIWNNKSFEVVPNHWGPGVYHVTRTTLVSLNATLTIEPGTTVSFDEGKGLGVEGKLIAQGTAAEPIIFTSNLSIKSPGDWSSISIYESADNSSVLDYVKIEYSREGLNLYGISPLVANSTFINNKERAIYAELSHSLLKNNYILRGDEGIFPRGIFSAGSRLILKNNTIQDMYIGLYWLNSNITMTANITMQDNEVKNCSFYGMFAKNSIIDSINDKFMENEKGVFIETESEAIFERLTITGGLEGFITSDDSNSILLNSTVEEVEITTFALSGDSIVDLLNCTFSTNDSYPGVSINPSDTSKLIVRNFLTVETISYDNGSILQDAIVRVFDGANLIHQVNTDVNGLTPQLVVTDRIYRPTLVENITRVYVSLGSLSFQNNNRSVAMNTSHTETFLGSIYEFNETDTVPPFVIGHYPTDDEVVLNIIITITFNEAMQSDTVEDSFSITPSVSGVFTMTSNTLIFIPQNLASNTYYTVTMGKDARDLANNSMLSSYQFSFTTKDFTDTTPPRIDDVYPIGTDVDVNIQSINITFSKEMQTFSTEPAFSITPRVPGMFSWENNTLYFQPVFELSQNTVYTVTMDGSKAQDTMGNALDGNGNGISEGSPVDDYIWQFTTKRVDYTPPKITRVYPTGSMVDIDQPIKIYFNEAMDITSVTEAFSYTNGTVTWTSLNGTWGKSKYIMTFRPNQPFNYSNTYNVTIKGTAEDLLTNTLDGNSNSIAEGSPIDDYTWSFRTIYDPNIGFPTIIDASPTGTGVNAQTEISINFSQSMNQPSAEEAFSITDGITTWSRDDGIFEWDSNRCIFIPLFTINYFTTYTVRINVTAKNIVGGPLDGNGNGIPEDYTIDAYSWSFTTGGPPELIISYVSIDSEEVQNETGIWFADSGGIVLIGVNITNYGLSNISRDFNVTLYNISGSGQPMNITLNSLDQFQDSGTLIFFWPAPTSLGDHFVEIIIDWGNKISELNEDNNTFSLHFAIGPDYVPQNVTVDQMDASDPSAVWFADLGVPVEIEVEAKNTGFSGVFQGITYSIAFWNATSSGVPIGASPFKLISGLDGLKAGEYSGIQSANWFVPNQIGHYYIVVIVDYDGTTNEIDENNNKFVLHFAFAPDYTKANAQVEGKDANDPDFWYNATASELVTIAVNVTNIGASGISNTITYNLSFYNSTPRGTPLEDAFYTLTLPGLLPGEDSGELIGIWLPPNQAQDYYVVVIIDVDDAILETDENNNLFVLHFKIGPDIVPRNVVVEGGKITKSPSPVIHVGPEENVSIEVNASNLGFSGTGFDFYLALFNGTRNGGMQDTPYVNISVSALSPYGQLGWDSGSISAYWNVPNKPGLYYVVIYIDISDVCRESNEDNNFWVLTFSVSPDLVPDNLTVDGLPISSYSNKIVTVLPGQEITIGALASSIGDSGTGTIQFSISFFNSTSIGQNLEPYFINWDTLGPLDSGMSTSDLYASWKAPFPGWATDYYINISVDSGYGVSEVDEENNYYLLHIKVDAPDLAPDRISVEIIGDSGLYIYEDPCASGYVSQEISLPLGFDLSITFDVINVGGVGLTTGTNVTFYNTSTLFGPQNATPFYETLPEWIVLDGRSSPSSDQTSEVGQTIVAYWTNPGVYGLWYINITIDFGNKTLEFSEYNNTFTIIVNVTDYPVTSILTSGPAYSALALYVNSSTELNLTVNGENPPFYTWYRIIDNSTGSVVKDWANYTNEGTNISMIWGEGTYIIEYNSTDFLGKKEVVRFRTVVVDDSKPNTNIYIGDPKYRATPSDNLNITSATPITLYAYDLPTGESPSPPILNASGVNTIYYRIQNLSTGINVTQWILAQEGIPFYLDDPVWGDGYYRIWFNSTDKLGQKELLNSITIYLDKTGPSINITVGDPKHVHPIYDWYVTSQTTFNITALELEGSGANLSTIMFKITYTDGGISSSWVPGFSFDIASYFLQGDGNYTIEYKSSDNLGNMQNTDILFVYVDDTPCTLELTIGEPKFREFSIDTYNITDQSEFSIIADDGAGSGIFNVEFRITNASYDSGWMLYTVPFNLTGLNDGVYTLWFRGLDNLGHSCTQSEEAYLDTKTPLTSIDIGEPKYKSAGSDFWKITSSTSIMLQGQYGTSSGLAYIEYRISNSTYDTGWIPYTGEFNLPLLFNDGFYFVSYRGVNNLNNTEQENMESIWLDNTEPESYISISGPAYKESPQDTWNISIDSIIIKNGIEGGWGPYGDNPPPGWDIKDYGQPPSSVWDTNDWHIYFFNSSLPGGTGTPAARAYYQPYEISNEWLITPVIDLSTGIHSSANLQFDHWWYNPNGNNSANLRYRLDGGPWVILDTFDSTEGGHLQYDMTFAIGHQVEIAFNFLNPDADINGLGWWFVDNVNVSSDSDVLLFENFDGEGSGVFTVWHRIFGNDTGFYYTGWRTDSSFSLNLPDGNYTIEYYAVDHLSNTGDLGFLMLYLDNTPPHTSITLGEPKYRLRETDLWIVTKNSSFSLSAEEGFGSGLSNIYYSIINDINIEVVSSMAYSQPFNLSGLGSDGQYKIRFWAKDNLDNTEILHEMMLIFDSGSPTIALSLPIGSGNSIYSYVEVVFSEKVDHKKAEQSFRITDGSQVWDRQHGFFNWVGRTMTFYPYESLPYETTFTVTINTTCMDYIGNRLDGDYDGTFEGESDIYVWYFQTVELLDFIPPEILSVYPQMNASGVGLYVGIFVEFSEAMNELTSEDAFFLAGGGKVFDSDNGNFTWVGNNMTYIFDETFSLETEYTVTISNIATDISGNHITSVFSWKFTTHGDITSPFILSHTPSGVNISVYTNITMEFSEPMNKTSLENNETFVLIPFINGRYDWVGNTFIFTPESKLKYETQYYVIIGLEAKDVSDNALSFPYEFNFTCEPDLIAPSAVAYYPSGLEVDINSTITITFDEPMQHEATEAAFSISPHIEGSFLWISNTLIFTPDALSIATVYTVTIGTGALDLAGNPLKSPFQFNFITKLDPYPPIIEEYSPTGSDVPVDSYITIRFNEAMNESSLHIAFEISPYVPGSFSFENYTLIFKPSGNLAKNTLYNVTIKSSARDLAGNHLGFDLSWKFTTEESEPEEAAPVAWDVVFLWIFIIIIVIILLLVFYEYFIKRRKILARGIKKTKEDEGEIDREFEEHEEKEFEDDEMGDEEPKEDESEGELEEKKEEELTEDEEEIVEEGEKDEPEDKDSFSEDYLNVLEEGFGLEDADDNK